MADFLVFFGSSEGFNYEIYDKDGLFSDFDRLFPDFEHFESKVFYIDKADNKPILAKYKLKVAGKPITLLKYYTFAQSSFSSRVEGSNIGVAFLSEDDLQLNKINYTLLKNLLLKFQQKSLNNNKFISGNFSNEALAVFQEYKDTNVFSVIEKQPLILGVISPLPPCGFFMDEVNGEVFNKVPENFDRIYLTADKAHLKRVYESSSGRFNIYFVENNILLNLKEQNEIKKVEENKLKQAAINNTSNFSSINIQQNELIKDEFDQLKNKYKLVLNKKKILTFIIGILSILLLISLLFNIFHGGDQKKEILISNPQNINSQNVKVPKPEFNEIAISFIDSIIDDKEKLKNFTSFLLYLNNIKNAKINSVTAEQFDEINLNIESYGILEFDETFFKKHQINLLNLKTSFSVNKKNISDKDYKKPLKKDTNKKP